MFKPYDKDIEQLKQNLSFLDTTEEEKDYSIIGSFTPDETKGKIRILQTLSSMSCRNPHRSGEQIL